MNRLYSLAKTGAEILTTITVITILSAGAAVWIVVGPGSPIRRKKAV